VIAVGIATLLLLTGGVGGLLLGSRPKSAARFYAWFLSGGCAVGIVPAVAFLVDGSDAAAWLQAAGPGNPALFGLDALSAWFLLVVFGIGAPASAFGLAYLREETDQRRVAAAHLLVATLLAAMVGVVTARTIVSFLVAWETMAVTGYFLVVYHSEDPQVRRAGFLYLVLTHAATLALLAMFAAWSGGNLRAAFQELPALGVAATGTSLVLPLALAGFGIKAGMVPFHFWLPGAHAAAPSHVSALLSGVMIKTGIYGLLRVVALAGPPPAWWGWLVLFLGLASALLGVIWALAQHDLKRLLAYHSVENIGIILLGLGLGSLGLAYRQPAVAALGFTGALLHTLNHGLFKSLLFLGAGVVARAAGTQDLERLGAWARRVPWTAGAFLIGALAISGLPPLNGFVSEWLLFGGLLRSADAPGPLRVAPSLTAGLALSGALALACFTKVYAAVFLGRPREDAVSRATANETGLVLPQLGLAAACVAVGLFASVAVGAAGRGAAVLTGGAAAPGAAVFTRGAVAISYLALGLAGVTLAVWVLRRSAGRARLPRTAPTWACGYTPVTSRMQYTAASYARPLLTTFGPAAGVRLPAAGPPSVLPPRDPVFDRVGQPLWRRVRQATTWLRRIQAGRLQQYLGYVILTVLALLLYLRLASGR